MPLQPLIYRSKLTYRVQNCRHRPRIRLLPPPRHVPRLARRNRRCRRRTRCQTFPIPPRLTDRTRPHLRRFGLCAGLGTVAAHGLGGFEHYSTRSGERKRQERGGHIGHDPGMVRVRAADHRHDWIVGHDFEYQSVGSVDRRLRRRRAWTPFVATVDVLTRRDNYRLHVRELFVWK